ncbi:MAG TPA: GH3 auxin-responsive promoter family protein, partial [Afifellaceae bacterium]|nr:GH3 auxin-responsive promoter family protein [Afifellaceae bacterium]
MLDATPLLRLYGRARRGRLARQDAARAQERQLMRLVRRARGTRFGRDHGFDAIHSVADFQRRVPLRRYEDFWEAYWKDAFPVLTDLTWPGTIPYFAVTSGTSSGRTKHIPVTRAMLRSNNGAGVDLLAHHLANRPESRVLGGKNFMLGGSVDLKELAPGVCSGDLTGITQNEVPSWAPAFIFPPRELAHEADWELKMEQIGRASLATDIRTIAGTPSWLLLYFDRLAQMAGGARRLAEYYPKLELLVHGGVNFAPYRPQFEAWLEGSGAELREVYPASEGFIAIADRGPGEGMRMVLDRGLFYELVPVEELDSAEPTRHWIGDAEPGRNYAIVLSSCAGLWAYVLGDTVRLVERNPPRLLVTGRTAYFLSAFGEHLTGEEIERAVAEAAAA